MSTLFDLSTRIRDSHSQSPLLVTSMQAKSLTSAMSHSSGSSSTPKSYHQSPFAIQQLLGLSTTNRSITPHSLNNKMCKPSSRSADNVLDESKASIRNHGPSVMDDDESSTSSSISVGSHETLSPISSPKLDAHRAAQSLNVSNLVANNFPSMTAYFPSRNSPLSHPLLHSSANGSCFGSLDGNQNNASRLNSYFNSPAAAAFMSAASMHVHGLHQHVNSFSKGQHGGAFSGSPNSMNNSINSMFHSFDADGKHSEYHAIMLEHIIITSFPGLSRASAAVVVVNPLLRMSELLH